MVWAGDGSDRALVVDMEAVSAIDAGGRGWMRFTNDRGGLPLLFANFLQDIVDACAMRRWTCEFPMQGVVGGRMCVEMLACRRVTRDASRRSAVAA